MSALLLLLAAQAAAPLAAPPLFEAPLSEAPLSEAPLSEAPLSDRALAEQRGGFRLPNGVDVALTVETQTAVNGALVLKTVFRVDQGAPTLTTYVPKAGTTVSVASGAGAATAATTTAPQISYDARGGIQVTPGLSTVGVSAAHAATGAVQDGLEVATGAVTTDAGRVTQATAGAVKTVTLDAGDLSVTHLAGNAFGAAIANSASDRTIDTSTSVSIDLANAGPDLVGSAMLRVEDVALGALATRTQ